MIIILQCTYTIYTLAVWQGIIIGSKMDLLVILTSSSGEAFSVVLVGLIFIDFFFLLSLLTLYFIYLSLFKSARMKEKIFEIVKYILLCTVTKMSFTAIFFYWVSHTYFYMPDEHYNIVYLRNYPIIVDEAMFLLMQGKTFLYVIITISPTLPKIH